MSPKVIFIILSLIAVLLEATADVFMKKWSLGNPAKFAVIGLAIYFISSLFWMWGLKYETLSKAVVLFTILNIVIVVIAGTIFFNETLTLRTKVGIIVALVAIVLLES